MNLPYKTSFVLTPRFVSIDKKSFAVAHQSFKISGDAKEV